MQQGAGLGPGAGNRFVQIESLEFYMTNSGAILATAGDYSALIFPRSIGRQAAVCLEGYDEEIFFDLS